jgi:hypothetical protein
MVLHRTTNHMLICHQRDSLHMADDCDDFQLSIPMAIAQIVQLGCSEAQRCESYTKRGGVLFCGDF